MCDIVTKNPDGHVEAIINHMVANILAAVATVRSTANKSMLDAHYLSELSEHEALERPLPDTRVIRKKAIKLLKDQKKKWKEEEKKKDGTLMDKHWEIPDEFLEKMVDWLLVNLLKFSKK